MHAHLLLQLLPLYTHQTSMVVLQLQCRPFCHMYLLTLASVVHINFAACSPQHSRSCCPVEEVHSGGVVHLLIWDIRKGYIRKGRSTQGYRGTNPWGMPYFPVNFTLDCHKPNPIRGNNISLHVIFRTPIIFRGWQSPRGCHILQ